MASAFLLLRLDHQYIGSVDNGMFLQQRIGLAPSGTVTVTITLTRKDGQFRLGQPDTLHCRAQIAPPRFELLHTPTPICHQYCMAETGLSGRGARVCAAAGCLLLYGCANIGEPMFPSLNIPVPITDLRVSQHSSSLAIDFTIPSITTDGVAVKSVRSVDLQVDGKEAPVYRTIPGPVHTQVPIDGLVGRNALVHVRLINAKGHASDWSNPVTVTVVPPLPAPSQVKAANDPAGVKVTWVAPGETHFRIFRRAPEDKTAAQIGESATTEYVDKTSVYGKTYVYSVQAVSGTAESDIAIAGPFTAKDEFPPAVPTGLTASPGINTVELAWDRNTEPDFKGYRVYRSAGDGPFARVADMLEGPSFSDKNIQAGQRYRYTVSAVDQVGNESKQSAPVTITP